MRKLIFIFLLVVANISVGEKPKEISAQYKIAFADIEQIFNMHPQTKKAQEVLMKEHEEWVVKKERLEKELELLEEDLKNLPLTASEQVRKDKQAQIEKKKDEINAVVAEASVYLPRRKEELETQILKIIQKAIEDVAKKENIDIILDKKVFLFGPEELDITEKIMDKLELIKRDKKQ